MMRDGVILHLVRALPVAQAERHVKHRYYRRAVRITPKIFCLERRVIFWEEEAPTDLKI